jgi:hypothetical protein
MIKLNKLSTLSRKCFGETVSYNTACATALIIPELIDTYNDNTAGRSER